MYFCTLFDSRYLSRGLALYESLREVSSDFQLIVFAFDNACYDFLILQELENMKVISLSEFEDEELLKIKSTRTMQEYCWTCTPSTISFSIKKFDLPYCVYLDADTYFFSDPKILIEEAGQNSVIITEHRFAPEYDNSELSGKYCVQFMYFKNNLEGMQVLEDWRADCIQWCYAKCENGKFGDQKYLDDWTRRYPSIWELQNIGGGVAPWNVKNYDIYLENSNVMVRSIHNLDVKRLVFFHFHDFKFRANGEWYSNGDYEISDSVYTEIYKNYLNRLYKVREKYPETSSMTDYPGAFEKLPKVYFEASIVARLSIENREDLRNHFFIEKEYSVLKSNLSQDERQTLSRYFIEASCFLLSADIRFVKEFEKANYYKENLFHREARPGKVLLLDLFLKIPFLRWIPILLKHENRKLLAES